MPLLSASSQHMAEIYLQPESFDACKRQCLASGPHYMCNVLFVGNNEWIFLSFSSMKLQNLDCDGLFFVAGVFPVPSSLRTWCCL